MTGVQQGCFMFPELNIYPETHVQDKGYSRGGEPVSQYGPF